MGVETIYRGAIPCKIKYQNELAPPPPPTGQAHLWLRYGAPTLCPRSDKTAKDSLNPLHQNYESV
jgi:hypothetical protein